VQLEDGSWWGVFLATRPFAGQSTLLGRETFLLPVSWQGGWPLFLPSGASVPLVAKRPALPASQGDAWDKWTDDFNEHALSREWLRIRNPGAVQDHALEGGELALIPSADAVGGLGTPVFWGKRLRHPTATVSTTMTFAPDKPGDFAGLLAFMDETHFLAFGLEGQQIVARRRTDAKQDERGEVVARAPQSGTGPVELRIAIDGRNAALSWRSPGGRWQMLAANVDVEPLATVHAGLFTGMVIGPYALAGR
jgi:alpha-N-arabinofuranosidase